MLRRQRAGALVEYGIAYGRYLVDLGWVEKEEGHTNLKIHAGPRKQKQADHDVFKSLCVPEMVTESPCSCSAFSELSQGILPLPSAHV